MDFYDLLAFIDVPKRIRFDLKKLTLSKPDKYTNTSSFWWGGKGNGKTTFACHILSHIMRLETNNGKYYLQKLDVKSDDFDRDYLPELQYRFCWFPKLLQDMKDSFGKRSDSDMLTRCMSAKVLVLDDLGVELSTDWAYQTLYLLVGHRYNEMLDTIFTSNISLEELSKKWQDTRITSRIEGMCGANIYEVEGDDKRIAEN